MILSLLGRFWPYILIAILALSTLHYRSALIASETELTTFKAEVRVLGEQAQREAKKKDDEAKLKKDKSDAQNAKTHAALAIALNGMRAQHPSSSFVPNAPASSSRPDLICFDRTEYIRADGAFTSGARGLSDEGTKATVDLDTAKNWAR